MTSCSNSKLLAHWSKHILPLDETETAEYIIHRLKLASNGNGATENVHFTPEALGAIYRFSQGTPRMVNIICDRALLAGFITEARDIDETVIEKCAREIMAP